MSIFVHLLSPTLGAMSALEKVALLGATGAVIYGLCMLCLARETLATGLRLLRQRRRRT